MDNYFTYERVIKNLRQLNVGIIGTARARRGWTPPEFKAITDDRFNTVYYLKMDGYIILRWVDNNIVTMVSTVHYPEPSVVSARRRPRKTSKNKGHVDTVWGDKLVIKIQIPQWIHDYNHWMGGIDKADQLISYYRPQLWCRRTWIPIFLHTLNCFRVNAYVLQ